MQSLQHPGAYYKHASTCWCCACIPSQELLLNIAPKKANWDLKRDIQGQLDKLERRTQKAIVEIIQEDERKRFEAEGGAVAVEQG